MDRLFVATASNLRWAAWVSNDRLVEFHAERLGQESLVGNIYLGRIVGTEKRLDAAFVDIGGERPAFLPLRKAHEPPVDGAMVVVQVERDGHDGKAPRVTTQAVLKGGRLILTPRRRGVTVSDRITDKGARAQLAGLVKAIAEPGEGWTVRTAAERAGSEILREEAGRLRALWRDISTRAAAEKPPTCLYREPAIELRLLRDHGARFGEVVLDGRAPAEAARAWSASEHLDMAPKIAFRRQNDWVPSPEEIFEQVDDALETRAGLPSGGTVSFEQTAALTAIDVDSAGAGGLPAEMGGERLFLQTNLEAAEAIAWQLRLRNIGGIVVIDFIDLKDAAARHRVVDRLRAAVEPDSASCWVGSMSRLGLVEMTRRRRGPTLAALLVEPCDGCGGTGWRRRAMTPGRAV